MLKAVVTAAVIAGLAAMTGGASAQQYPTQDIHLICAFPAGSGADIFVRYYGEKLRALTGKTIVVENKVGAVGNIATEYVARAKPDGYTIYITGGSSIAANMSIFKNPPVDVTKAIQIVALLNKQPYVLAVDAQKPWKSLAELTAYLKEKKGKASYVTTNPSGKVMGALYKQLAGIEAVEVPYRTSSDSANDLKSGALDFAMYDPVYASAGAREGRLRILAISTGSRMEADPSLPTMKEQGIDMDLLGWFAAMVPMGTPRPVIEQLNKLFNQINATEESRKFLNSIGGDPWIGTPEEGQARLLRDVKDWGGYVRMANIEPQG